MPRRERISAWSIFPSRGQRPRLQLLAGTRLESQVSLQDYSVTNRGLRSGLVGTGEKVRERIAEFEDAGVDLLLLQSARNSKRWSGSARR